MSVTLRTLAPYSITSTDVTSGGYSIEFGDPLTTAPTISSKGVKVSTSPIPFNNTVPTTGITVDPTITPYPFYISVSGLNPNTPYYIRAYVVIDGVGFYGNEYSFKTYESGYVANSQLTSTILLNPNESRTIPKGVEIVRVDMDSEADRGCIESPCMTIPLDEYHVV